MFISFLDPSKTWIFIFNLAVIVIMPRHLMRIVLVLIPNLNNFINV